MKKNLTELVFILDCSGSMQGLEEDTIGGFNAMIEKQKKEEGEVIVSTVLFNHNVNVFHNRVSLETIQPMTDKVYYPRGTTALLDAVGNAIAHIGHTHKCMDPEELPERTMFVITTDGKENASREYSLEKVKRMVQERTEKDKWEFLFLGANIDAIKTAGKIGILPDRAANFHSDRKGTALNYEVVSDTVSFVRRGGKMGSSWKQRISQDFESRKG